MMLSDLLDELRNNILRDRSDQVSGPSDYLWSDQTLIRYINQAERRFARLSLSLRDASTPQCCTLNLVANTTIYPLDKSVIAVISAKYPGDPGDIARAGHSQLNTYYMPDPYFFDPAQIAVQPPGKVLAFTTDEEVQPDDDGARSVVTMRVYPTPIAPYATPLALRVVRMPLNPLIDPLDEPEIAEEFHLDMLDWAAYLALRISDHDAGDYQRALAFKASFEQNAENARKATLRKLFTPSAWGFGRNGFSWIGN
jgi:hypothetical protein